MACLRPIRLRNPKYRYSDKTTFGKLPLDWELLVPCGKCVDCRRSVARDWRVRLLLETEYWTRKGKQSYFVTFTLDESKYDYFCLNSDKPIRWFLENYRRKVGKSCKHFLITELGKDTHRLHYHGILFAPELSEKELKKLWIYGFSFFGYCSYNTAKYVSKYILKPQLSEPWYKPKKFVSPGLGKHYIDRAKDLHHDGDNNFYCKIDGYKYNLPRYLRNKLYSEEYLRSLQYDRYMADFNLLDWKKQLTVDRIQYDNVEEYLRAREDRLIDSLQRKASTPLKPVLDPIAGIRADTSWQVFPMFDLETNIEKEPF